MPTLAEVRTAVDTKLTSLWINQIVPRETQYALNHGGRYWQGIITTDLSQLADNLTAASTVSEMVPDITRHPTDQASSWQTAGVDLGTTLPCALVIDVYDGPQGCGFVASVYAMWNGTIYSRSQNSGPETWRTQPWSVVTVNQAQGALK